MAKPEMYCHKEVGIFLRNAALAATRHEAGPIESARHAKLREYAMGIIEALSEDVNDGYLNWQELTAALLAAALVLHQTKVPRQGVN